MTINTDLSPQEMLQLNTKVDGFNKKLRAENQGSKNSLDEADFMKLLVTQLKTQDPTKPLDDKQFIGQMAQFTSLKQMNNLTEGFRTLAKEFAFTKAVNLVGKEIAWTDETGRELSGVVDSIRVKSGETFLNAQGMELRLDQVREVRDIRAAGTPVAEPSIPLKYQKPAEVAPVGAEEFILPEPAAAQ